MRFLSRRMVAAAALLVALVLFVPLDRAAMAQEPVVQGILAYDPTCGSCETVLHEVLPALEARFGRQLDIVRVDVSTVEGFDIWTAGTRTYQVPNEKKGVPLLFLGDRALSGEIEIAEQLPGAIEAGIAAGGVPLADAVALSDADKARWAAHNAAAPVGVPKADPVSFGLAFVVLAGTALGLCFAAFLVWRARPISLRGLSERASVGRSIAIPLLGLAGLLVAGYLSYLHMTRSAAICPVGDCDAVQHSSWSNLFGVPVAYLGLLTYGALLGLWAWSRSGRGERAWLSNVLVLGIAAFGTAFSAYLTLLELFVIYAVCMWCLVSAVVMTLLLVAAAAPLYRPGPSPAPRPATGTARATRGAHTTTQVAPAYCATSEAESAATTRRRRRRKSGSR